MWKNNINHQQLIIIKLKKNPFFEGVPLKGNVASKLFLDFAPEIKRTIVGKSSA